MPEAIQARGLVKRYGEVDALTGLDLTVAEGTVLGLLGPNGAGKTTCVRILATLLQPDAGHATVVGLDVVRQAKQLRRVIGLSGQYAAVDEHLTGFENLDMVGRLYHLGRDRSRARAHELLERFDLVEAGGRPVKGYSGGMRRRLDLAAALVAAPPVLFLDEPTTGLDPRSRQTMWEAVTELAAAGTTVLLTTQYLEEADRLADRIALLDAGRIVAEGTAADLKRRVADQRLDLTLADPPSYALVAGRLGDRVVHREPDRLLLGVATDGSAAHVRALLDEADPHRDAVDRFAVHGATLDDVFLALTGRTATRTGTTEKETAGV